MAAFHSAAESIHGDWTLWRTVVLAQVGEPVPLTSLPGVTAGIPLGTTWRSAFRTVAAGEILLMSELVAPIDDRGSHVDWRKTSGEAGVLPESLLFSVALGLIGTSTMRRALPPLGIRLLVMLGIEDARFHRPLKAGETMHVTTELVSARASKSTPGRGVMNLVDRVYVGSELLLEFTRINLYDRVAVHTGSDPQPSE